MPTATSVREKLDVIRNQPPERIRALLDPERSDADPFLLAANLLTLNWVDGNPRTDWEGKPFDWHPVTHPSDDRKHHFRDWYDRIRANPANMILAGRKHTKTTFADCLLIYRSEYIPGHASLYWANTQNQVKDRMGELEEIAAANPWLENVHPDGGKFSKRFGNGAVIDTTWVTGSYEGGHVDLQLGDDPMKELGDISDDGVEHWYGNVIVPTLNPGNTLQAIIGTRKRPNDLYEILRKRHESEGFGDGVPGYSLTEYPAVREAWEAEYDRPQDLAPDACYHTVRAPTLADELDLPGEEVSLLWPEARDADFLVRNLGMQGRKYFLREFCMVYTEVEDAVVHREWISNTEAERAPPTRFDGEAFAPADYPEAVTRADFDRVVVGHDPAGSGRDRFAFVTVGALTHPHDSLPPAMRSLAIDEDGNPVDVTLRHILDAWQAQDVPPSRWRSKLASLYERYQPDSIAIESNLNATWTSDDEAIDPRVRNAIDPIATGRGKHSWTDGVPAIGADIERGVYRFYTGGGESNMTGELINALTTLRREDGELVGHTPDLVMALYMTHKALASGDIGSSRASMGTSGEGDDREKRNDLKDSEVGQAILETDRKRRRGESGYY